MKRAKDLKKFQGRMRRKPTPSERAFALKLKSAGIEFKQQMILGFYLLDFALPIQMLCVEIDGTSHDDREQYDKLRDHFISTTGFRVIRIRNEDVRSYPVEMLKEFPTFPHKVFRHACSRANVLKGLAMQRKSLLPNPLQQSLLV